MTLNLTTPSAAKLTRLVAMACLLALAACSSLQQRTVSITETELQKKVADQLTLPISVLEIFDIHLTNPVVKLDGVTQRLYAEMDTSVENPLTSIPIIGKLSISGKLRFDAAYNAIMLSDARVENVSFAGIGSRYNKMAAALANKIGPEILNNTPLYTLTSQDLQSGSKQYTPKDFRITGQHLQVTLVPNHPRNQIITLISIS